MGGKKYATEGKARAAVRMAGLDGFPYKIKNIPRSDKTNGNYHFQPLFSPALAADVATIKARGFAAIIAKEPLDTPESRA